MSNGPAPYLVALRLDGAPCLVVGAGPVAARKAASLIESGACVTVVAPAVSEAMMAVVSEAPGSVRLERRPYQARDVDGQRVVVTATGDPEVDRSVFLDAERAGIPVNAADTPSSCTFYLPAVARAGGVSIGVSTGGGSPFLAAWVRDRVASALGPEVATLAEIVAGARSSIVEAGRSTAGCDWQGLVEGELWPLLEEGDAAAAWAAAERWVSARLDEHRRAAPGRAEV